MLRGLPPLTDPNVLVSSSTRDDAGIYRLTDEIALVQTVDYFTPIVDDPYDYGAIAAANSLSDVYAMGGQPLTAMNVLAFPPDKVDEETLSGIVRGGAEKCAEAGAALIGGHTVEAPEPLFGLSVTGIVHPDRVLTNAGLRPGQLLVLTKPLGTAVLATAAKFDECEADDLAVAVRSMSRLNAEARDLMIDLGATAATDVTGFGLAGHLSQMAFVSGAAVEVWADKLPLLPGFEKYVEAGNVTKGGRMNRESTADRVVLKEGLPKHLIEAVFDPQTSGGLLFSVDEGLLDADALPDWAVVIGRTLSGEPRMTVRYT